MIAAMPAARRSPDPIVRTSIRSASEEIRVRHPFNTRSQCFMRRLSDPTGLTHLGVSLARVPPGHESFALHVHSVQEEWMFILSGEGRVQIDDEERVVGPGDFIGFPPRGPAHLVRNTSDVDLVYLQGGDRREGDIVRFPDLHLVSYQHDDEHMAFVPEGNVELRPLSDWTAED